PAAPPPRPARLGPRGFRRRRLAQVREELAPLGVLYGKSHESRRSRDARKKRRRWRHEVADLEPGRRHPLPRRGLPRRARSPRPAAARARLRADLADRARRQSRKARRGTSEGRPTYEPKES